MNIQQDQRSLHEVLTIERLRGLAESGGMPVEKLALLVGLLADRFQTAVCSAYLLEPDRNSMLLAARRGLRPECAGQLRLQWTEGLAGMRAEQVAPVAVEQARNHPRFKYSPEAGDDIVQSSLGLPAAGGTSSSFS